ncbi:MAG TPA: ATP-binding protein, partial [Candidatus Paceibacterota bacterium]
MAISIKDLRQVKATQPPRCMIYGPPGIGKTTLAAEWPKPIFLQVEDGTPSDLSLTSFGRLTSYNDVMEALAALYTEEHGGRTVVIDSLDKLEPLVWAKVCEDNQWQNIETPGYGRGYVSADAMWRELLEGMNALRRDKDMGIVYIAHSTIETVNDPLTASYSRY